MQVSVKADVKRLTKDLNKIQKQQIPFATALALTRTAKYTAQRVGEDTKKYLDRPAPFTQKGFRFEKATKKTLTATVMAKDIQAEYLQWSIYGGKERPNRRAHVIPQDLKRNKYGNIPKGQIKKLLANPNVFSGNVGGIGGIWERRSTALRLLVIYKKETKYKKRFPFDKRVAFHASKAFPNQFIGALQRALATAR